MYILYYLNENLTLQTMEVQTLNNPILITEPTIFVAIRSDKGFEKEPHECLNLTHLERLFIYSDFNDTSFLMEGHFRKPNTFLTSSCEIDPSGEPVFDIVFENESDVNLYYDEGQVIRFPQHPDLPNEQCTVHLGVDGIEYITAGILEDETGFYWNDHQRLYFTDIGSKLQPLIDAIEQTSGLENYYVWFENTNNQKRTKVFLLSAI